MKKIILWSLVSILVAAIAIDAFLWLRKPQVVTLSDGTKLTLLKVEYGKHHKYPKIKTTGQRMMGGGPTAFDTTNDTLVVWILSEHKGNQYPNYQVMAYDKAATACVGDWGGGNSSEIKNGVYVMGVQLAAFPRRDSKIYLRIMNYGSRGEQVAKGQFVISNPARGPFEKWNPETLPDAQSDGDLDVTLTKLNYGQRGFGGMGRTKDDPMSKAVFAAFHTEQKGVVVTNWQPVRIETSDATGNHVVNNSCSNSRDENGDATMTYQWGLWPDEPAWKLRVEMSRTSGFNDDEQWTVENLPVKPGSQQDMWNYGGQNSRANPAFAETNINDIHVKIFPAEQFTDVQRGNGQPEGGFRIQIDPAPEGVHIALIKIADDQGRVLQSWNPSWGGGSFEYQLQSLRNVKSLNITLALHKSRFVEFTVKAQKAAANGP